MMTGTSFLALPAELRLQIYEHVADDDLLAFADCFRWPYLLDIKSWGVASEYSDVLFSEKRGRLEMYCTETGSWHAVCGSAAKETIMRKATFHAFLDRSLASAQRYTARKAVHRLMARYGILTLLIGGAPRLWLWEYYD